MIDEVSIGRIMDAIEANRHRIDVFRQEVAYFFQTHLTLKLKKVYTQASITSSDHRFQVTRYVVKFRSEPFLRRFGVR
jgi:hypothetical protein